MQDNVFERLKIIIDNSGLNIKDFAKKCDIPYRTMQDYLAGKSMPGGDNLQKITTFSRASIDWLLTGEGEMRRRYPAEQGAPEVMAEKAAIYNVKDPVVAEIIGLLETEPPEVKRICLKILKNRQEIKEGFQSLMDFNKQMKEGEGRSS